MTEKQEKTCKICNETFVLTMKTERYCATCRPYINIHKSNMNWLEPKKKRRKSLESNAIAYLFSKPKRKIPNNIYKG